MRIRHVAPLLGCAAFLACSEAGAQYVVPSGGIAGGPAVAAMPGTASAYYAPRPREYVGYGTADIFPYYGRYYGRPYDAWTWPYMSGAYQAGMARYYYPPLR